MRSFTARALMERPFRLGMAGAFVVIAVGVFAAGESGAASVLGVVAAISVIALVRGTGILQRSPTHVGLDDEVAADLVNMAVRVASRGSTTTAASQTNNNGG